MEQKKCSTEKLITVDLICHGVPSPKIFRDYIAFLNKGSKRLDHFSFRTKKFPWGYGSKSFGCTIYWKNGREETDSARARLFLNLFFSNNCIRKHCHFCEYCGFDKPADITIADYWGLKEAHPTFFDERGVSAVITHNDKASQFFKSTDVLWVDSSIEKISLKQANMSHPSPQSAQCNEFWKDYNKGGFMAVAKKYGGYNIKGIIHRSWMFKIINKILKRA